MRAPVEQLGPRVLLRTPHGHAALAVRERTGATVLALERGGVTQPNPQPGDALGGGDRVLAFGSRGALANLRALLAELAESPDDGAS